MDDDSDEQSPRTVPSPATEKSTPSLSSYFPSNGKRAGRYSDLECLRISQYLRHDGHTAWSEVPRLYIVLRLIKQLQLLDRLVDQGITDLWLPFAPSSLPRGLPSSAHADFLEAQQAVLTKAVDLEGGTSHGHAHFGKDDLFPLELTGKLGTGAFASVVKMYSPLSRREFAVKRFRRRAMTASQRDWQSFVTELQILKRIDHRHCVELMSSYTDTKYFGLIMSPVADSNLGIFLDQPFTDHLRLQVASFYGCLASALCYLHESKIRHRDIKPENILVKGSQVYLTDFGISLDWQHLSRSTTTEDTGKSLIYCAPEVAQVEKRNSASDIWSLGCIFVEMFTVQKNRSRTDLRAYLMKYAETHRFYVRPDIVRRWMSDTRVGNTPADDQCSDWIHSMLAVDPALRPSASQLYHSISTCSEQGKEDFALCGACCAQTSDSSSEEPDDLDDDDLVRSFDQYIALSPDRGVSEHSSETLSNIETGEVPTARQVVEARSLASLDGTGINTRVADNIAEISRKQCPNDDSSAVTSSTKPQLAAQLDNQTLIDAAIRNLTANIDVINDPTLAPVLKRLMAKGITQDQIADNQDYINSSIKSTIVTHGNELKKQRRGDKDRISHRGRDGELRMISKESDRSRISPSAQAEKAPDPNFSIDNANLKALHVPRTRKVPFKLRAKLTTFPNLKASDWRKPSSLLQAIKADADFMKHVRSRDGHIYKQIREAKLVDLHFVLDVLLWNCLRINNKAYIEHEISDEKGATPLLWTLHDNWKEHPDPVSIFELFAFFSADVDHVMQDGRIVLSRASAQGYVEVLNYLLGRGYDIECADDVGYTPLHHAAANGAFESTRTLLWSGANVKAKSTAGKTAFEYACQFGHTSIVKLFLENANDCLAFCKGTRCERAVFIAAAHRDVETVASLLGYGRNPDVSTKDRQSPHIIATITGATDLSGSAKEIFYTIPEDGSPLTIPTGNIRGLKEMLGSNKSQTSLSIEYFEDGTGDEANPRPSVRVRVKPSSNRPGREASEQIFATEAHRNSPKPSHTRRISLGSKSRNENTAQEARSDRSYIGSP